MVPLSQPTGPARVRSFALVGVTTGERRAVHTAGYPLDPEQMLPIADVLLLVADAEPGAMLFRYTAYGELAGDTWHASVADAQAQAILEYGDALLAWDDVPPEIIDAHAFAVQCAADRLNGR
ncbi:MAG TPA: hypothetical protein VIF32_13905 [Gemmatimonadaceae bacterium]